MLSANYCDEIVIPNEKRVVQTLLSFLLFGNIWTIIHGLKTDNIINLKER